VRATVPRSTFAAVTQFTLTWEGLACSMSADERRCPLLVQARQLQQRQRLVAQADVHRLHARVHVADPVFVQSSASHCCSALNALKLGATNIGFVVAAERNSLTAAVCHCHVESRVICRAASV